MLRAGGSTIPSLMLLNERARTPSGQAYSENMFLQGRKKGYSDMCIGAYAIPACWLRRCNSA
eukprot:2591046-Alexandrium_andersonii.AAC.1